MANLAQYLSKMLDHPVLDKTGLTGTYDIQLMFARDMGLSAASDGPHPPTVFEALDEIGLKLERAKGAADRMVIVIAEKEPREN